MDSTAFRILDALSQNPGCKYSINGLVGRIRELGYSAYYKNVYDRVQELKEEGILDVRKTGNTSLVSLHFNGPHVFDELAVMELEKKKRLINKHPQTGTFIHDLEAQLDDSHSLALVRPDENIKLNTTDILCLTKPENTEDILKRCRLLGQKHNTRIHPLTLTTEEFTRLLESREQNPVWEILADKIVLTNPAGFWKTAGEARIPESRRERHGPHRMSMRELYSNLSRFGYAAFTVNEGGEAEEYCIESTITACLLNDDARLREAAPILLTKNHINYRLLLYLAVKHKRVNSAGYFMEAAKELIQDEEKKKTLGQALKLFMLFRETPREVEASNPVAEKWGVETRTTLRDLEETMRLYNAV